MSQPETGLTRRFVAILTAAAVVFAAIPFLMGTVATPDGGMYLGYQYATDDHMVYAAWMRQAMDGRLLFDNRFTTDAQPGLTIHLYFFLLGLVAKVTGIALASNLARLALTAAFVPLCAGLVRRLPVSGVAQRLSLVLSVFGGGLGFLAWQTFGEADPTSPLAGLLSGRLPTDTWQPEGYVFSSMLTNGLFMVSLCLILLAFRAYLDARESWRAVPLGAVAVGLLMNVHSYDVLLVALVLVGFLAACVARKQVTGPWVARSVVITLGVLPAALWFMHVLQSDAVFQARAATETYAPNFRPVLFGYLPLIASALVGLGRRALPGTALIGVLYLGLYVAAANHAGGYFLSGGAFALVFLVAVAATVLAATGDLTWDLLIAWAFIGTIAIYFPGLFQRKLAMGLALPWSLLAGVGLAKAGEKLSGPVRTLGLVAGCLVLGATALRWLTRELAFISGNVSRTAVHPVFLTADQTKIMEALNKLSGRHVLIAPTGQPAVPLEKLNQTPITQLSPAVPDLNPIASGLTGVYTFAGHWSETPHYLDQRRPVLDRLFYGRGDEAERRALIAQTGADYMIVLNPDAFSGSDLFDFRPFGEVVVAGKQFSLIHLPSTAQ